MPYGIRHLVPSILSLANDRASKRTDDSDSAESRFRHLPEWQFEHYHCWPRDRFQRLYVRHRNYIGQRFPYHCGRVSSYAKAVCRFGSCGYTLHSLRN